MNNWLHRFPRLNELLEKFELERIELQRSDNVIAGYIEWGNREPGVQKDAELIEANLSRLDSKAWKDLIEKVLSYSCSKRGSIKRGQFWNHLNEVRGYVLLANRGYSEIEFLKPKIIKKGQTPEFADIIAGFPTRAILEVKTINRSDDDRERDRKRTDPSFLESDITDLPGFANKMSQMSDPVSAFLWKQLDMANQQLLVNHLSDTKHVKSTLVKKLNAIIKGPCIYEEERFQGVRLQPKTEYLLDFQEDSLVLCLNRCLLDDAYPQELSSWSKSVDGFVAAPPPGVPAPIPNKLLKKCEERIEKARNQIETTLKSIPPVEKKIVLLIINRDFNCHLITMEQLEAQLQKPDLEVVCQFGDCY